MEVLRIEHFFEGEKEFFFADNAIAIIIDGFDGLE